MKNRPIDLSDQLSTYSNALRRTLKWYRKIAIELLLGTTCVNARFVYTKMAHKKISITEFRGKIVEGMLKTQRENSEFNNEDNSKNVRTWLIKNYRLEKKKKEKLKLCTNIVVSVTEESKEMI